MIDLPPSTPRFPLSGAVLAGGRARRFGGQDKTQLKVGQQSLLTRTLAILDSFCAETMISSNTLPQLEGRRVIADRQKGQGPLGAIYSCLLAASHPHLLIVAGDMPFITAAALTKLWYEKEDFDVILPQSPDGLQPLAGIYKQSCIAGIGRQLQNNNFKIRGFFAEVRVKVVTCSDFPDIYPDNTFLNINSPDDLQRAFALYRKTEPQINRLNFLP
ncbi:MAG: molybdenum cofactor guanylyltransferase [Deltaproteobacteria bacterium]|nr:molybdenum cofactor guanylyltransferase [Deltaproteobacteria bacterium]